MMAYEDLQILQPLRIPAGWKITFNDFFMLDPAQYTGSDTDFRENLSRICSILSMNGL